MYKFNAIINNEKIITESQLEILNPVTQKVCGTVSALKSEDIDYAFLSARRAQKPWENLGYNRRKEYLLKLRNLIDANKEELASIMMNEIAKVYKEALTEVIRTVEYMDLTFIEAEKMIDLVIKGDAYGSIGKVGTFKRVAKGVGVAISPFNYPINLAMAKIAPALLMGNTIVFKPATQGSLIGSRLAELVFEAQLPAGAFNLITGRGREIGDLIVTNKEINFISFTGSVPVGQHLLEIASSKDVVLELGGKDPAIILDDLNLEYYAKEIISGAYSYSGQRCTAIKRVITTNEIANKLVPLLQNKVETMSIGLPADNAMITPVIDLGTAKFLKGLIDDAKDKGAHILTGDKFDGTLVHPTLIDHVTEEMRIAWEEPFGPILPIIRTDRIDDMIRIANASDFGLQASIYTQDINLALQVANEIETGTVNINGKSQRGPDVFPFMGIKNSGFGTQGIGETLLSVTRYKGIVLNK